MKRYRTLIIVIVIAGLAVGGYFGYQQYLKVQSSITTAYKTIELQKGSLTALVGATGTVRTNQSAILTWQTSGSVAEVKVTTGQKISAGDTLALVEKTTLPQNIILAEADLISARRSLENLKNSQIAKAQAQLNLATASKAVDDAQTKRDNLNFGRGTQLTVDTYQANYLAAQNTLKKAQEDYDKVKDRGADDRLRTIFLNALYDARRRRDSAKAAYDWFLEKASDFDLAAADANLALAKAQQADAQREWDRLKNGADPADVQAAQARITALEATLRLQKISAPFSGVVTDARVKPGDQVNPGTIAFRIDDTSRILVDVQISEVDINRIAVDQPVTLSFDAIQNKTYNGHISDVGRYGTNVNGTVNFTVTVELTDADENVHPGMTAAVNIVVNQLQDVLLIPNRAVRLKDGKRVVYLLHGTTVETVVITLGASSETNSQILTGNVGEGDLAILNPPAEVRAASGPPSFVGN